MQISGVRTHIFLSGREVLRCPRLWIESRRHAPLPRAGVTLPDPKGELAQSVSAGDAMEIRLGYRDKAPTSWVGTVMWTRPGETPDQIEVGAAHTQALLLDSTLVTQAWMDETAEAIVRWAVGQTGLAIAQIDSPGCTLPRCNVSTIPAWQVARQVAHSAERACGVDMSAWALWLGADGVHWGDHDEDGDVPVIATGAGLIRHAPASDAAGLNEVETFLLPDFSHSRLFKLTDNRRGVSGSFRALAVRHEVTGSKARTYIQYGVEHGQY
ncbi:MAG: hypothetical protein PWQ57_916 [Desulfovibrionales bacterium]|jgi:hypothetical protein|nr:hypothetical protein [Desulfovibrionales bacterium]